MIDYDLFESFQASLSCGTVLLTMLSHQKWQVSHRHIEDLALVVVVRSVL